VYLALTLGAKLERGEVPLAKTSEGVECSGNGFGKMPGQERGSGVSHVKNLFGMTRHQTNFGIQGGGRSAETCCLKIRNEREVRLM